MDSNIKHVYGRVNTPACRTGRITAAALATGGTRITIPEALAPEVSIAKGDKVAIGLLHDGRYILMLHAQGLTVRQLPKCRYLQVLISTISPVAPPVEAEIIDGVACFERGAFAPIPGGDNEPK